MKMLLKVQASLPNFYSGWKCSRQFSKVKSLLKITADKSTALDISEYSNKIQVIVSMG